MPTKREALSDKQLRWIDEYLVDLNGAAAAVRAGYSPKSARAIAHENLTKPDILAVLQEKQVAMAHKLQVTREGVVKGLLDAAKMGRLLQNPAAMVSALSTIAKMLGYFSPELKRVELTTSQQTTYRDLSRLSDAELLDIIQSGTALTPLPH